MVVMTNTFRGSGARHGSLYPADEHLEHFDLVACRRSIGDLGRIKQTLIEKDVGVRLLEQGHGRPGQEVGIEALEILRPKQEEGRVDVHDIVAIF
jgi:hypothetical protein